MPSTVIRSYRYRSDIQTLVITFISGISYKYLEVTEKEYTAFKKAFSKGTYFNKYIKPNHRFEKISE
jgi:hypothetical protein